MTAPKTPAALPPDVTAADLGYESAGKSLTGAELEALGLGYDSAWNYRFEFYLCSSCGKGEQWVLTTLPISGGRPPRTYGIGVADSKVYTVGRGPHVKAVVEVRLTRENLPRLRRYVELWKQGMAAAGGIRDRISSRRAQGQIHRAAGRQSWRWDS